MRKAFCLTLNVYSLYILIILSKKNLFNNKLIVLLSYSSLRKKHFQISVNSILIVL